MMPGMAPAPGFFGAYQPPKNDVPFARWLYFLAFSIPPLGLIFGLIYLLKETPEERAVGKWIMIWSVIGGIIAWLSWIALVGALHSLASQSGQLSGLLGGDPTGGAASTLNHAVPSSYSNSMGGIPAR
ncbi:MAG TPA: hypothetical protein VFJ58_25740 [Armatimonadota bacterium]|nr:hypothetical protein [Armatimonadota bacterium]